MQSFATSRKEFSVRSKRGALLTFLLLPALTTASQADGLTVDTSSRQQSADFYNNHYVIANPPAIAWTGSQDECDPGTTSTAFKNEVLNRINYFRAMAGVPANVTFNSTYSLKAQQAALMMSANGQLAHTPPEDWHCFSPDGAEGARNSNLFLGLNGWDAISGYIDDPGDGNDFVGHRRWILYPQTQQMGTGDIPRSSYHPANALWVFDGRYGTARPATTHEFVSWPPPGYVPYQVVSPRWSFSFPDADFSAATVTMKRGSTKVTVSLSTPAVGYGENTLVWTTSETTSVWPKPSADTAYDVTVGNVKVSSGTRTFSYRVIVFDPVTATAACTVSGKCISIIADANFTGIVRNPLAGVQLTLKKSGNTVGTATSLADGTYSFANVAPGQYVLSTSTTRPTQPVTNMDPASRTFTVQNANVTLDRFALYSIFGTVTGPKTGGVIGPIANAIVRLVNQNGVEVATRTTGADGRYEFRQQRSATFTLKAQATGYTFPNVSRTPPGAGQSFSPCVRANFAGTKVTSASTKSF